VKFIKSLSIILYFLFESQVAQRTTCTFARVSTEINMPLLFSGAEHYDHCDALMSNGEEESVGIFR
jgi:hypothetical protein